LFQKLTKAFDIKDIALSTAEQKTRRLEAELKEVRPVKRRRVLPDPNEEFVRIEDVWAAQERDGDKSPARSESPASGDSNDIMDCTVVN
jgi:hypothetical protein